MLLVLSSPASSLSSTYIDRGIFDVEFKALQVLILSEIENVAYAIQKHFT
jgi:hypothetical protein